MFQSILRSFSLACLALLLPLGGQVLAQSIQGCDDCEEAAALVARFELAEGAAPVRDRPSWAPPAKIVTMRGDQWASLLRTVAPDAEIVGVDSPEAAVAVIPGADVYIGLCTAAIVKAGTALRWIHLISAGADPCASQPGVAEGDILLTSSQGLHSPAVADHRSMARVHCSARS